jgi:hypothetical protein
MNIISDQAETKEATLLELKRLIYNYGSSYRYLKIWARIDFEDFSISFDRLQNYDWKIIINKKENGECCLSDAMSEDDLAGWLNRTKTNIEVYQLKKKRDYNVYRSDLAQALWWILKS